MSLFVLARPSTRARYSVSGGFHDAQDRLLRARDSTKLILLSRFFLPLPSLTRKPCICCNVCATQRARPQGHTIYSVILLDPATISPLQYLTSVPPLSP